MTHAAAFPDEIPCVEQPAVPDANGEPWDPAADPDVALSGEAASAAQNLRWTNLDLVSRARARKLARLRWRRSPPAGPAGEAANFLPEATLRAFAIPEDVPISAHQYREPVVDLIRHNRDRLFLDVGAGLRHTYYANVVNTDIYPSICTDVMCVGEDLPFADEQFDYVFCFAVLEHTMHPWDVAREMCRVLKPGGTILVDWPFLQPVHGYPHHYFNATPTGNRSLFEAFCEITSVEVLAHHHPAIAAQWILTAWRDGLPAAVAREFEGLTVETLIKDSIVTQLRQDYCRELHAELKRAIACGSLMTGVRRAMTIPGSNAAENWPVEVAKRNESLLQEIDALRRSTSWRITSPLRALGRRLRGG